MTKKEFNALRSQYRRTCKRHFVAAEKRSANEFILSDETVNLYETYWLELHDFAERVGCSIPLASAMLNLF